MQQARHHRERFGGWRTIQTRSIPAYCPQIDDYRFHQDFELQLVGGVADQGIVRIGEAQEGGEIEKVSRTRAVTKA